MARKIEQAGVRVGAAAGTNRSRLITALSNSKESFLFSGGDYLIDNSGTDVNIPSFEGRIAFLPGSKLVFTDNTKRGIKFTGGVGAEIASINTAFQTRPTSRVSTMDCISFISTTDTRLANTKVLASAAGGVIFQECIRPSVRGVYIYDTRADGLHFANCQDASVDDLETENTDDDGLAFLNYTIYADNWGGRATNIKAKNSDRRGIAVIGQRGVVVSNFLIDSTNAPGITVGYDSAAGTRTSLTDTRFSNGEILNTGSYIKSGGTTTNSGYGLWLDSQPSIAGSPPDSNMEFADIHIRNSATQGILSEVNRGFVRLEGITVEDSAAHSFYCRYSPHLYLDECVAIDGADQAFRIQDTAAFHYGELTSVNCSKTNAGSTLVAEFRARTTSEFTNHLIQGGKLKVFDNQATTTGYGVDVVEESGKTWRGDMGDVSHVLANNLSLTTSGVLTHPTAVIHGRQSLVQGTTRTQAFTDI